MGSSLILSSQPKNDKKLCPFLSVKKRSDKNIATNAGSGFQAAIDSALLPESVTLRSDAEHTIWGQFTRARGREDWRDKDLILLAKVVRMEAHF